MAQLYRRFLDGKPIYLVRYYWWAYLWPRSAWFFDHQLIINAILFGQYRRLMQATLDRLAAQPGGRLLQLTCVYGDLTPALLQHQGERGLHITDVAELQLELAEKKRHEDQKLYATRMNAEALAYRSNSFHSIVLFFLLHEMPPEARRKTLAECMRVIEPGGRLLISEYGPLPRQHWLYRLRPQRWLMTRLEPFLEGFWHEALTALLDELAAAYDKEVRVVSHEGIFNDFYRVTEFEIVRRSGGEQQ